MITAGGSDGKIRFWDWNTFACLGYLSIHPGRLIDVLLPPPNNQAVAAAAGRSSGAVSSPQQQQQRLYYSPVVSTYFCHERSSLISLCRDGHVHEWKVEESYRRRKEKMIQRKKIIILR